MCEIDYEYSYAKHFNYIVANIACCRNIADLYGTKKDKMIKLYYSYIRNEIVMFGY